jgi:hypothetical protein
VLVGSGGSVKWRRSISKKLNDNPPLGQASPSWQRPPARRAFAATDRTTVALHFTAGFGEGSPREKQTLRLPDDLETGDLFPFSPTAGAHRMLRTGHLHERKRTTLQGTEPMKNELVMCLFSRRALTDSVARDQITALSEFGGGLMRPDKCGEVEPIRTPFDRADINKPVQWLSAYHGEFFYRKGRPTHAAGQMWNRTHPPTARFPSPLFSNYWTGQFDGSWANRVGIEKVEDFLCEMFRVTGSDFGLLTTEADRQAKNRPERSFSYVGLDLSRGIPGLYWINLFSEELADWLGLSDLPKNLALMKRLAGGGVLLKFGESRDHCRSLEVLRKQRVAIEWLGPQRFFDLRFPDRKLDSPNWTAWEESQA